MLNQLKTNNTYKIDMLSDEVKNIIIDKDNIIVSKDNIIIEKDNHILKIIEENNNQFLLSLQNINGRDNIIAEKDIMIAKLQEENKLTLKNILNKIFKYDKTS